MCQCTLFDVGGVEIHSIEYCTKDQSNVKNVEDTLYRFQCIKSYVCLKKSFGKLRLSNHTIQPYYQILCMLKYVEDAKGRNNLLHLQHASTYIRFDSMVGKP